MRGMAKHFTKRLPVLLGSAICTIALVAGCGASQGAAESSSATSTESATSGASSSSAEAPAASTEEAPSESAVPETTEEEAAPTPPKNPKLTVGIASVTFQCADVIVAKELGLFEKYGLDVTLAPLNGSGALTAALASNSVQIAEGEGSSTAAAVLSGQDTVFFGNAISVVPMQLWATDGINSVTDLMGKRMGSSAAGSLTQIATTAVLDKFGMTMDDVNLVSLGSATSKWAALKSNAVDASLGNPPAGDKVARDTDGAVTMIFDAAELPNLTNAYVASREYAEANEDVLVAFLQATREAIVTIKTQPESVMPIIAESSEETDEELLAIAYKYYAPLFDVDAATDPSLMDIAFHNAADAKGTSLDGVDPSSYYLAGPAASLVDNGFIAKMQEAAGAK